MARPVKRPTPAKKSAKRVKRPAVDNKGWIPSYAPSYGPKQAKVTIVTFSDFECPFCARGAQVLDQIKKAYKNKVHIVFRHFPLSFHPNAHLAGQASLAANAQGKFWAYHDKLFANQENLTKADLLKYAKQLKLDMAKFKQALDKGIYKKQVDADFAFGNKVAKVQGTPYFSLRTAKYTRVVEGAYPLSHFRPILDALLAGKKPPPKPADSDDNGDQDQQGQQPPAKPKGPVTINLKGAPSFGPAKAKVTIVEFSDFECPYCSEGASLMNRLKKAFGKQVRFVFKHLPLPFHKDAHLAAQASMAAHAQGKFWAYHDKLFANQKNLKKTDLLKFARQLKLDVTKFKQALDKGTYKKYVDADFAEARKIRVEGTPTFYVNGYEPPGGASFDNVKAMIARIQAGQPAIAPPAPKKPKVVKPVKIDIGKAIQFGPVNAKVTIVSFSDFECPYCSQGATILKQVLKAYKGKVRFVFKNMPLSFHPHAHLAAQAALAAHAQGKFWVFHDKLFGDQDNMKKADLLKYAKQLKLDMAKFKQALKKGIYKAQVDKELAQAQQVGVDGTPTCYINGYKVEGAQPFSRFKAVIDALLAGKPFPAEADDSSGSDNSGDSGDGDDTQQEPPKPKGPVTINLKGAPSVGPANSGVTVVEFSDFECPYCSEGASLMNRLKKALGTKVRFVFKHLPLSFHPNAHLAAQASMAAHAQGKFWQMHDKLFANQDNLKKTDLLKYAKQLKLDVTKFKQALDKGTYKTYVDADFAEARKIRVGGTPTFYVNGVELTDTPSFEAFKAMLEKALKARSKPTPRPRAKVPAKRRPVPPRLR